MKRPQKPVRGDPCDGRRRSPYREGLLLVGCVGVGLLRLAGPSPVGSGGSSCVAYDLIGKIHADSRAAYGARRVHAELTLGFGIAVGHEAVEMLMRRAGLQGLSGRLKYRKVPNLPTASDLVDRDFARSDPDRL